MVMLFAGCANISTLSRTTALPSKSDTKSDGTGSNTNITGSNLESRGLAIHLDALQRVVLAKSDIVCPEPAPGALQAYASALALGVNIPGVGGGEAQQASATNAASIGLRTNAVEVLRDYLFSLCLASYNGKITEFDYAHQLGQTQFLVLGLHAIEKLTGTVAAHQVALEMNANADASRNLIDTKAMLDRARSAEKTALDNFTTLTSTREKQQKALDAKNAELIKASPEEQTRLSGELKTIQTQLEKDKQAEEQAKTSYAEAQAVTKAVQSNFDAANTAVSAAGVGTNRFSSGSNTHTVNLTALNAVSGAVERIVYNILQRGHLKDSCISIMQKYEKLTSAEKEKKKDGKPIDTALEAKINAMKDLYSQCKEIIKENVTENLIKPLENITINPLHPIIQGDLFMAVPKE